MKHYFEVTLLPNPEVGGNFLWSRVFQQIHLGLVTMQDNQGRVPIGLSYPNYLTCQKHSVLGSKIRFFAQDETTLTRFDVSKCLAQLSDYVHWTSIRPVPERVAGFSIYKREQPKNNKERLARRYAKRHKLAYDMALQCYNNMKDHTITAPFIRLKSLSSGQPFCLWIRRSASENPSDGTFSSYGLSSSSTVPEF